MLVKYLNSNEQDSWNSYVCYFAYSNLYHLSGWQRIVENTYGHKTFYLMAINDNPHLVQRNTKQETIHQTSVVGSELNGNLIVGTLPLVHLKHFLFGNSLISMPFFDSGGILADNAESEKALLAAAIKLGQKLRVRHIELRQLKPLSWIQEMNQKNLSFVGCQSYPTRSDNRTSLFTYETKSHKVRMLLNLPESSDVLMKSFKAKLRSQIKKPLKEGLHPKVGGLELLEDFYKVFSINMRDLGSPVHSKKLMRNVLRKFPEQAKIVMVYRDTQPLASSLIVGFKDTLANPWASALREYSRLSPNMLLYWTMLKYACDNGYRYFDFGRSSPDEGTYKFKKQWGAKPTPLHWYYISLNGRPIDTRASEKSKIVSAIRYWQKLPLPVTKILGPRIRKHISL